MGYSQSYDIKTFILTLVNRETQLFITSIQPKSFSNKFNYSTELTIKQASRKTKTTYQQEAETETETAYQRKLLHTNVKCFVNN